MFGISKPFPTGSFAFYSLQAKRLLKKRVLGGLDHVLKDVLTATVSTQERKGKSCVLHLLFRLGLKQAPVPDFRLQRSLSSCKSDVPFGVEKSAVVGNGALFLIFFYRGGDSI